jgi:hypothetical protein
LVSLADQLVAAITNAHDIVEISVGVAGQSNGAPAIPTSIRVMCQRPRFDV